MAFSRRATHIRWFLALDKNKDGFVEPNDLIKSNIDELAKQFELSLPQTAALVNTLTEKITQRKKVDQRKFLDELTEVFPKAMIAASHQRRSLGGDGGGGGGGGGEDPEIATLRLDFFCLDKQHTGYIATSDLSRHLGISAKDMTDMMKRCHLPPSAPVDFDGYTKLKRSMREAVTKRKGSLFFAGLPEDLKEEAQPKIPPFTSPVKSKQSGPPSPTEPAQDLPRVSGVDLHPLLPAPAAPDTEWKRGGSSRAGFASLSKGAYKALKKVFEGLDKKGTGQIGPEEFAEYHKISVAEAKEIMARCDMDGDGVMEFDEFVALNQYAHTLVAEASTKSDHNLEGMFEGAMDNPLDGLDEGFIQYLRDRFNKMDADGSGNISLEEFQEFTGMSAEDAQDTFDEVDMDGDDQLNFEEFVVALQSTEVWDVLLEAHNQTITHITIKEGGSSDSDGTPRKKEGGYEIGYSIKGHAGVDGATNAQGIPVIPRLSLKSNNDKDEYYDYSTARQLKSQRSSQTLQMVSDYLPASNRVTADQAKDPEIARVIKMFEELDKDGDGTVSFEELSAMIDPNMKNSFVGMDQLSFDEFLTFMSGFGLELFAAQAPNAISNSLKLGDRIIALPAVFRECSCIFRLMDQDKSGCVSSHEIAGMLRIPPSQSDLIVQMADVDGNGEIDFPEFFKFMCSQDPSCLFSRIAATAQPPPLKYSLSKGKMLRSNSLSSISKDDNPHDEVNKQQVKRYSMLFRGLESESQKPDPSPEFSDKKQFIEFLESNAALGAGAVTDITNVSSQLEFEGFAEELTALEKAQMTMFVSLLKQNSRPPKILEQLEPANPSSPNFETAHKLFDRLKSRYRNETGELTTMHVIEIVQEAMHSPHYDPSPDDYALHAALSIDVAFHEPAPVSKDQFVAICSRYPQALHKVDATTIQAERVVPGMTVGEASVASMVSVVGSIANFESDKQKLKNFLNGLHLVDDVSRCQITDYLRMFWALDTDHSGNLDKDKLISMIEGDGGAVPDMMGVYFQLQQLLEQAEVPGMSSEHITILIDEFVEAMLDYDATCAAGCDITAMLDCLGLTQPLAKDQLEVFKQEYEQLKTEFGESLSVRDVLQKKFPALGDDEMNTVLQYCSSDAVLDTDELWQFVALIEGIQDSTGTQAVPIPVRAADGTMKAHPQQPPPFRRSHSKTTPVVTKPPEPAKPATPVSEAKSSARDPATPTTHTTEKRPKRVSFDPEAKLGDDSLESLIDSLHADDSGNVKLADIKMLLQDEDKRQKQSKLEIEQLKAEVSVLSKASSELGDSQIQLQAAKQELDLANEELASTKQEIVETAQSLDVSKKELSKVQETFSHTKHQLNAVNLQLSTVQSDIQQMQHQEGEIKSKCNEAKQQHQSINQEIEQLRRQLKELQAQHQQLQHDIATKRAEYEQVKQQVTDVTLQLNNTRQHLTTAQQNELSQHEQLQSQIIEAKREYETTKQRVATTQTEVEGAKRELAQAQQQLNASKDQFTTEKLDHHAQLTKLQTQILNAQKEDLEKRELVSKAEQQLQAAKQSLATTQQEDRFQHERVQSQISDSTQQLETLKLQVSTMHHELAEKKQQLQETKQQLANAQYEQRNQQELLQSQIQTLKQQLATTQQDMSEKQQQLHDTKQQLNNAQQEERTQRERVQNQIADSSRQLEILKQQVATTQHEMVDKQQQLSETQQQLRDCKQKLQLAQSEAALVHQQQMTTTQSDLATMQRQLSNAQQQLSSTNTELSSQQQLLETSRQSLGGIQHQIQDKKQQLETVRDEASDLEERARRAKRQMAETQQDLGDNQQRLSATQTKLSSTQDELLQTQQRVSAAQTMLLDTQRQLEEAQRKAVDSQHRVAEAQRQLSETHAQISIQSNYRETVATGGGVYPAAVPVNRQAYYSGGALQSPQQMQDSPQQQMLPDSTTFKQLQETHKQLSTSQQLLSRTQEQMASVQQQLRDSEQQLQTSQRQNQALARQVQQLEENNRHMKISRTNLKPEQNGLNNHITDANGHHHHDQGYYNNNISNSNNSTGLNGTRNYHPSSYSNTEIDRLLADAESRIAATTHQLSNLLRANKQLRAQLAEKDLALQERADDSRRWALTKLTSEQGGTTGGPAFDTSLPVFVRDADLMTMVTEVQHSLSNALASTEGDDAYRHSDSKGHVIAPVGNQELWDEASRVLHQAQTENDSTDVLLQHMRAYKQNVRNYSRAGQGVVSRFRTLDTRLSLMTASLLEASQHN